MTGRPVEQTVEPAFIPAAHPSRHRRSEGAAPAGAAAAAAAPGSPAPSRLKARSTTGGAYQYTSFIQKIKRWQTVALTLTQRIDKVPELRAEHNDPAVGEQLLNESWGQLRVHLDAMVKAAAGLIETTSKPSIDFGAVEIQTLKMLKGMKPAINAVRVAAVLEDTPGMSGSLLRRMKTACGGIQRLVAGLSTRELLAQETQTELRAAVKEMQTPINQILKHASKGVEEAKAMAQRERVRAAQAAKYAKEQAAKRRQAEAEEKAREKAELAAMSATQRKVRAAQMEREAAEAIAQAQQDAEQMYIENAVKRNPRLKSHFSGPEPPADLSTSGFIESEEGLYDTGTVARAGFDTDGARISAKEDAANAKKDAFLRKLRLEQEAEQAERDEQMRLASAEADYVAAKILSAADEGEIDPLDVFEN